MNLKSEWERQQRIHDMEHECGLSRTLSCDAVGHLPLTDVYQSLDDNYKRKFLREYRTVPA